jgi:hypothetical protein
MWRGHGGLVQEKKQTLKKPELGRRAQILHFAGVNSGRFAAPLIEPGAPPVGECRNTRQIAAFLHCRS